MGINFGLSIGNVCTTAVCAVAQNIIYLINGVLVPVLFAIAFIVFLWGIANAYIFSGGDSEKVSQGHKLILWGIIAFVVMISIWGLVNVVANTFGLAGSYAPPPPYSPYMTSGGSAPGQQSQTQYIQCPNRDALGNCI